MTNRRSCQACGASATADAVFCEHCGADLVSEAPPETMPTAPEPQYGAPERRPYAAPADPQQHHVPQQETYQQPTYAPQNQLTRERKSPGAAAVLSIIPGLGQAYVGNYTRGGSIFVGFIAVIFFFVILGVFSWAAPVYWIANMWDAYRTAKSYNQQQGYQD